MNMDISFQKITIFEDGVWVGCTRSWTGVVQKWETDSYNFFFVDLGFVGFDCKGLCKLW